MAMAAEKTRRARQFLQELRVAELLFGAPRESRLPAKRLKPINRLHYP